MSQKISIQFRVNTIPIAQPRQKHAFNKNIGRVINYIDKGNPVVAYKHAVQAALLDMWGTKQAPLDIPLEIRLHFVFPRPKNMIWKKRDMPPVPHTKKPDFDNLAKSTCDALNGLLWHDDSLICKATIIKTIASGTEIPHVYVSVCDYDDYDLYQADTRDAYNDENPWCVSCREKNCEVGFDGECNMLRRYLTECKF